MKIIKIGTWDENGMPTGWHFDMDGEVSEWFLHIMSLEPDGRVLVNGIEIAPWTNERKLKMLNADRKEPLPCPPTTGMPVTAYCGKKD